MNGKAATVVAMYSRIRTFFSILITPFTLVGLESSPFHLVDRYFRSAPKFAAMLVDFSFATFAMLVGADSHAQIGARIRSKEKKRKRGEMSVEEV